MDLIIESKKYSGKEIIMAKMALLNFFYKNLLRLEERGFKCLIYKLF